MNAAPPGAAAISATDVRKDYGDRAVLRGIDLSVGWGEVAVLFGANGAGKTTLLRVFAGLARPDSGSVHIAGRRMGRTGGAARRAVGFAGHQTLLYNDLTCRENLAFYCKLYEVSDAKHRIAEVLERLDLSDRADRRVRTLSHGMQKRLSMARAILHDPAVLLLDEPESGLATASLEALGNLLRHWAESGRSVLLTTHNTEIGLTWAGRALALSDGRLTTDFPVTVSSGEDCVNVLAGGVDS